VGDVTLGDEAAPSLEIHAPRALSLLSSLYGTLGETRPGRALLRLLPLRPFSRRLLRTTVVQPEFDRPDDITVLIGIRDRSDYRIRLALRSLREQTHPADQVRILVIDYGSDPTDAAAVAERCDEYGAEYLHVDGVDRWSRGRCLNIGIRRVTTKYLITSDADILFSRTYIANAIEALRAAPFSVICAPMLDLPEDSVGHVRAVADAGSPLRLDEWRRSSAPRNDWATHPSITATFSAYYQMVRGFDEFFELWGSEDVDMMRRLKRLGLDRLALPSDDAFYLHQWHPKYENLLAGTVGQREMTIRRNADHYRRSNTILRNPEAWGTGVVRDRLG
jgi:hypothetical protein